MCVCTFGVLMMHVSLHISTNVKPTSWWLKRKLDIRSHILREHSCMHVHILDGGAGYFCSFLCNWHLNLSFTHTHKHTCSIIVLYYWCSQNILSIHTYTSCRFSSKSSFISQWKPIFSGVCAALRGSCGAICEWFERSEGNWILMTDALFGLQHYTHTCTHTHTSTEEAYINQSPGSVSLHVVTVWCVHHTRIGIHTQAQCAAERIC